MAITMKTLTELSGSLIRMAAKAVAANAAAVKAAVRVAARAAISLGKFPLFLRP